MKRLDIERISDNLWRVSVRSACMEAVCKFVDNTEYAHACSLDTLNLIHIHFNGLVTACDKRKLTKSLERITTKRKTCNCKVEALKQACIKHLNNDPGRPEEYHKDIANALRDMGVTI